MAIYEFDVQFNVHCHLTADGVNPHEARVKVSQLQASLLDEVGNWTTTELLSLDTSLKITHVVPGA